MLLMLKSIHKIIMRLKTRINKITKNALIFVELHPLGSFFTLLAITLVLIVIGDVFRNPKISQEKDIKLVKEVSVYNIGSAPKMLIQGKIEKTGVIKIVALTSGVISQIYKSEGQTIQKGQWLMSLSSNYQGGSSPSLTRQLAATNYQFLLDNFDTQKELIEKNKEIANKVESQSSELRTISSKSIDETKSLISLNENVLSMIDSQISKLELINVNGASDSAILQLKTGKSSAISGLNQAKSSLRNLEYQTSSDQEPAEIAKIQKDLTIKQLELQEKTLHLNREIARLNLRLSEIQESLLYPVSPFHGTVERIFVKPGSYVSTGAVLASINGDVKTLKAVVTTSKSIAERISLLEPSFIYSGLTAVSVYPLYVSHEPVSGNLHAVIYSIPEEFDTQFTNDQIVSIDVPIGIAHTFSSDPFVPIDALYQTQTENSLFIVEKEKQTKNYKVRNISVTIGNAYGSYIEVLTGLKNSDQVVLDRNVIDGDIVVIKN